MTAEYIINGIGIKTSYCYIFFIARKNGEFRVFGYREWPWEDSEGQIPDAVKSKITQPTLFILSGALNLYGTNTAYEEDLASTYSPDKVQQVSFLLRERPTVLVNLVVQTSANTVVSSLRGNEYYKRILGLTDLIPQKMVT